MFEACNLGHFKWMGKETRKRWPQQCIIASVKVKVHALDLTLNVVYHTIPHKLCRCEVKNMHGLQSFVSQESGSCFSSHLQYKKKFNICIFEREFSHFFRVVGLGV